MVKILIAGLIGILAHVLVTIGIWKFELLQKMRKQAEPVAIKSEIFKTKNVNIPVISQGEVKGYIVVQFGYRIEGDEAKKTSETAEMYILDEAINALYASTAKLGGQLERYQIQELTPALLKKVQERLSTTKITDLMLQEFTFVPRADVR